MSESHPDIMSFVANADPDALRAEGAKIMNLILIALAAVWVAGAIFGFGATNAFFLKRYAHLYYWGAAQTAYPNLYFSGWDSREPGLLFKAPIVALSCVVAISSPFSLLVLITGWRWRHGLKFRWWRPEPYLPELKMKHSK